MRGVRHYSSSARRRHVDGLIHLYVLSFRFTEISRQTYCGKPYNDKETTYSFMRGHRGAIFTWAAWY